MKLLVIRFSSIGDMVLTTPVVRCLKQQLRDVQVHYLTKKQFLPVIEANPNIDRIHTIEKNIDEVLPALREENYDHIIDLHKNFRSRGICMKLKVKCHSFTKVNLQKWLMVNFKINRLPAVHIVDRYFGAVTHLDVTNDGKGLDYFIPEQDASLGNDLPESHREGYIAWVIGGKHNTKIYPEEKVASICGQVMHPFILIGGPEDAEKGSRIAQASGKHVYNACGKFNLNRSAALVRDASLVLSNDTGMMHVAAAFKKKIVSFWGNTIPEFGMVPYMPGNESRSHILEVKNLSCRPCSKLGYKACPKGHFNCMNEIREEDVVRMIKNLSGSKNND